MRVPLAGLRGALGQSGVCVCGGGEGAVPERLEMNFIFLFYWQNRSGLRARFRAYSTGSARASFRGSFFVVSLHPQILFYWQSRGIFQGLDLLLLHRRILFQLGEPEQLGSDFRAISGRLRAYSTGQSHWRMRLHRNCIKFRIGLNRFFFFWPDI